MPKHISFEYKPQKEYLLFTLEDQPILSRENLMGLTADIGAGKSQICEIFASYWINPKQATHNIKCINNDGKCLYIDTERTANDCYTGLLRIQQHTQASIEEIENKLIYMSTMDCISAEERIKYIKKILKEHSQVRLVIIDTLLDCVNNANDLYESTLLCQEFINLAQTTSTAILYSLHGNRNDNSGKGKGHIGDVFQRKSESFLKLIASKTKKTLTSDFANGKVRNGYDKIKSEFIWNNNKSCLEEGQTVAKEIQPDPFVLIFKENKTLLYKELVTKYTDLTKYKERTAARHIKKAIEDGIIKKEYNEYILLI